MLMISNAKTEQCWESAESYDEPTVLFEANDLHMTESKYQFLELPRAKAQQLKVNLRLTHSLGMNVLVLLLTHSWTTRFTYCPFLPTSSAVYLVRTTWFSIEGVVFYNAFAISVALVFEWKNAISLPFSTKLFEFWCTFWKMK